MALAISRRPDALLHAQFWAEDGHFWYAEAYNGGWLHAALTPHTGYFQTISRLTAALSLLVDFASAPVVYNVIALVIQVSPAIFLLTPRFQKVVPDNRIRVFLAFLYIGMPNSYELNANITNAMTHLAILAVMVFLAEPSRRAAWRAFDIFVVMLSGLSGPFVFALGPVALIRWAVDRHSRWRLVLLGVVAGAVAVQLIAVLTTGSATRPHAPLGVSVSAFLAIVAGNIFAGAVIGLTHYTVIFSEPWWGPHSLALRAAFVGGGGIFLYAIYRGTLELRLFILFAWILLIGSLLSPTASFTDPQWPLLSHPGAANRYFLVPMLAFLASAAWIVFEAKMWALRIAAGLVLGGTIAVAIPADWQYPPYSDQRPEYYATVLRAASPGSKVVIPINPPGWDLELIKR
jgi:hypothetical protein